MFDFVPTTFPPFANVYQFLFIDVLLILPIAIFSKFKFNGLRHCFRVQHILICVYSGLVGPIASTEQEATNSQFGVAKGSHPFTGSNNHLYRCSGRRVAYCSRARMVGPTSSFSTKATRADRFLSGTSRLVSSTRSPILGTLRTRRCF